MAVAKGEVIQLSGILDIRQAESIHEILKNTKNSKKSAVLDFKTADDIDLAILQLLFSFKKSMKEDNRTVEFENISDRIKERISLSDFNELLQGS